MGILDSIRKSNQEKTQPNIPPQKGHSLSEIIQDKKKLDLFGKLLKERGDEELAKRLADKKLEDSDILLLEDRRKLFTGKMVESEKIEKLLTKDNIIDLARSHEDFATVVNNLTPEKAIRVIQSRMKELAITDEGKFEEIVSKMGEVESYKSGKHKA